MYLSCFGVEKNHVCNSWLGDQIFYLLIARNSSVIQRREGRAATPVRMSFSYLDPA